MGFWPFVRKPKEPSAIRANSVLMHDGIATIDVRDQTCPGYLLAINKAVEALPFGTTAQLLISYPPCEDDVGAWCKARSIEHLATSSRGGIWVIEVRK
ncbi:MAG TPA: sulfurtransferase TusA family protein [Gallionellaceae bacterium]|nr:sulfurtransferase TusA family protein [Gallionellaceae bacterium]